MNDVSQTEFDTLQPTHLTHCNQLLCSEKYILDQSAEVLLCLWYNSAFSRNQITYLKPILL